MTAAPSGSLPALRGVPRGSSTATGRPPVVHTFKSLPQGDHEAGRQMLNGFQAWQGDRDVGSQGRQFAPDGVLKADIELGGGAGGHLGDDG